MLIVFCVFLVFKVHRKVVTSEVGGSEPNREIVSFRSCVRTRGLVVRSELEKI